ncbi:hypothetical protein NP493_548g01020 [Ridgeia piscesae]|uniref:Uncharacterized protein n=1 Tax=Ridgeia piscesae TaxID=27915 RepID=A0AAD9KVX5_RIDPI|nr:hypothetical protein NP493_548g01020 [Ridgeia piscesae]
MLECIEKLGACHKLTVLNLRENYIDYINNLECCPQLWKIDLANNQVRNLEGFSRFLALGSLILCNNNLSWNSLAKIRHMHILELSLHGNPELECTAYYRFHVIDCLPHIWTLDGRVITSTERVQVKQFFHDSALGKNPTRHKLVSRPFTPTALKQIRQNGVFGERTKQLMLSFPEGGVRNSDMDYRRLGYLGYNLQEDLLIEGLESERIAKVMAHNERILEELLAARQHDRYRCGRVLLLLVGSLEFAIPTQLMAEALGETGLGNFGNLPVMQLFMLPKEARCTITCLLLNAVKVDRDAGKQGGLSDKMYVAVHNVMFRLVKKSQGGVSAYKKVVRRELNATKMGRRLVASEVIQLLAYVPNFFEFLMNDQGLLQLVLVASPNDGTKNKIIRMLKQMHDGETEVQKIYRDAANIVLSAVKESTSLSPGRDVISRQEAFLLNTCKALPRRPPSLPIFSADYLSSGKSTPDLRPTRVTSCRGIQKNLKVQARLGDQVLLGALNIAKIIAMPESDLLLVQMDRIPAETCGMMKTVKDQKDHYLYVDRKDLEWDFQCGYWRPIGTVGDM